MLGAFRDAVLQLHFCQIFIGKIPLLQEAISAIRFLCYSKQKPTNFSHFPLDNACYATIGGPPLPHTKPGRRYLTREEDEMLTRVGPGTPCGKLMRHDWHPSAATVQVKDNPVRQA